MVKKLINILALFTLLAVLVSCGASEDAGSLSSAASDAAASDAGEPDTAASGEAAIEKDASEEDGESETDGYAAESEEGEEVPVISFETVDLDGNPVNSADIFSQNRITILNLWGTYCGPCINEMPDLEVLSGRLKEKDCGLIGIVIDVWDPEDSAMVSTAKEIISDTGVTYLNLLPWSSLPMDLPAEFIPTTYFIDTEGHVIGEAAVGARGADEYEALLDAVLEQLNGSALSDRSL